MSFAYDASLLIANYDALTLSERVNAVQAARQAGADAARDEARAVGGFDQPTATADTYHGVVAEPSLIDLEDDPVAAAYQRLTDADPRVRAFREGWATDMRDAAEAARENGDDSAALTEFITVCEAELKTLKSA